MKKFFILAFKFIVVVFAVAGFGLLAAYVAVGLHLTDTKGIVDGQSDAFWKAGRAAAAISDTQKYNGPRDVFFNSQNYCFLKAIKSDYPGDFTRIFNLAMADKKDLAQKNLDTLGAVLNNSIISCSNDNDPGISKQDFEVLAGTVDSKSPFAWATSDEWEFFKSSVLKDKNILDRVQSETGVNSRILVSQLMAEQMRLFYSDRPWFKKAIAPLKVLGSMTQFSWGVFGIKPETAMKIEDNLKNSNSVYYPGQVFETLLDFQTKNTDQERFERIIDSNNHYYAYLYAALYNKEIMAQWQKNGFDISTRPEVLATLFNIGFAHSKPNADPQVGGAELQVGDSVYSFGRLASEFYYSGELLDVFPQYNPSPVQNNNALQLSEKPTEKNIVEDPVSAVAPPASAESAPDWPKWLSALAASVSK